MPANDRTKAQEAYEGLRAAIVRAEIDSRDFLEESELMARFGVGRTPLREALKRLTHEQFVVWAPHKTPYVRALTAPEIHHLAEARLICEGSAARLAALRSSAKEVNDLDEVIAEMEKAESREAFYDIVELDYDFHSRVAAMSRNHFLASAIDNLNCSSLRLWYATNSVLGILGVGERHRPIYQALASGNGNAAEDAMRGHITRSLERHNQAVRTDF